MMPEEHVLRIGLRVLDCYNHHKAANPEDVRALQEWASGIRAGWEPDTLATYIVEAVVKRRAAKAVPAD